MHRPTDILRPILTLLLLCGMGELCAQQSDTASAVASLHLPLSADKAITIRPYGFVRTYLNFDSRQTYTVLNGEYNMLPYDNQWNEDNSCDINAMQHMQLQALTSRFGFSVDGPQVLSMKSHAVIETDFGGFGTNNSILRLRLAYVQLSRINNRHRSDGSTDINRLTFTIGHDWHPLSGNIMPDVLGMAAGAPFRPHSRTPQVRVDAYRGALGITAAVLSQLQFTNNGPVSPSDPTSTASASFAYNAVWPEGFLGINLKTENLYLQLGINAQVLCPRTHAYIGGVTRRVSEHVESLTPTFYAQYTTGSLSLKFRTLLAQNTSHLNQLVGYAVTGINPDSSWSYSPQRAAISYLNISYGNTLRANLFLGYMKNLGCTETLLDFDGNGSYIIYLKGGDLFNHLNSAWRIAPSLSYNTRLFSIGIEYELTAATFGDLAPDASILINDNLHQVLNHRICAMVKYNF